MSSSPRTLSRRTMVKVSAGAAAAALLPAGAAALGPAGCTNGTPAGATAWKGFPGEERYPFALPPLPYPAGALEAAIDAQTMEIHHGRHHQGYVNNLNGALEPHPDLHGKTLAELLAELEALPTDIRTAVRNHGGGHLNHALFWSSLSPTGGGRPQGEIAAALEARWGSFEAFREEFSRAAGSVFGSGWGWLAQAPSGRLEIATTPNQDNPVPAGLAPLLGLDVWEHAYYLRYQNRRGDYIQAFWEVVDWAEVERRFRQAG